MLVFFFRFRDSLEGDVIVVRAIQSDHKVSSYRLVKPSKYSRSKRPSHFDRRTSKMERLEKEGAGRKESQRDTGNEKSFMPSLIKISKPSCVSVGATLECSSGPRAQPLASPFIPLE